MKKVHSKLCSTAWSTIGQFQMKQLYTGKHDDCILMWNTTGEMSVTLWNREHLFTINYDFSLNKFLICCLLIFSKVVVKFRYGVGLV